MFQPSSLVKGYGGVLTKVMDTLIKGETIDINGIQLWKQECLIDFIVEKVFHIYINTLFL